MAAALSLEYWVVPEINATQFTHYGSITEAQAAAAAGVVEAALEGSLQHRG